MMARDYAGMLADVRLLLENDKKYNNGNNNMISVNNNITLNNNNHINVSNQNAFQHMIS